MPFVSDPAVFNTLSVYENLLVGVGIVASGGAKWADASAMRHPQRRQWTRYLERFNLTAIATSRPACCPRVCASCSTSPWPWREARILLLTNHTSGVVGGPRSSGYGHGHGSVRAQQVTVLFVEHDHGYRNRYTHRVLAFYEGRIIAAGEPGVVLDDAEVSSRDRRRARPAEASMLRLKRSMFLYGRRPAGMDHGMVPTGKFAGLIAQWAARPR